MVDCSYNKQHTSFTNCYFTVLMSMFIGFVFADFDSLKTHFNRKFRKTNSGVPNDTKTGNLTYDSTSTSNVFPRQLQLIINFPGKKISALHC